jgi:hypothetical protein
MNNTFNFLRDPIWQFIGAVLALVIIIITIIFSSKQRKKKKLAYNIITNTPVLSINEELNTNLEVLFNKSPVKNLQLLIIKLLNTGNTEICKEDFEEPISVNFSENMELLSIEFINKTPSNLDPHGQYSKKRFSINPMLLNSGDSLTIKFLINNYKKLPKIEGRIKGVKSIEKQKPTYQFFMIFAVLILTGITISDFVFKTDKTFLDVRITTWIALLGVILALIGTKQFKQKNKVYKT